MLLQRPIRDHYLHHAHYRMRWHPLADEVDKLVRDYGFVYSTGSLDKVPSLVDRCGVSAGCACEEDVRHCYFGFDEPASGEFEILS